MVVDSRFTNNNSDGGGAIDNATDDTGTGTLSVTGSTFSDNHANNFSGGAILNGYGTGNDGNVTISDSTFSGNTAFFDDGGAIDSGDNDGIRLPHHLAHDVRGQLPRGHPKRRGRNGHFDGQRDCRSCEQDPGETWTDNGYNVGSDSSCSAPVPATS